MKVCSKEYNLKFYVMQSDEHKRPWCNQNPKPTYKMDEKFTAYALTGPPKGLRSSASSFLMLYTAADSLLLMAASTSLTNIMIHGNAPLMRHCRLQQSTEFSCLYVHRSA